ncbi:uncharacterized protein DNG_07469 [Cephalotrichum gorgonifer]|uniref:Zn(2)-C6 fungal-type domain-containing protein n=1 Tax=Cephalotrichum gorgonifer TaxID=2041049 RepID=A0AAE8SXI3_9PEZI|nr:uncharacterized protein DNG_07469 [Cephalotrichum gorgonifer]
MQKAANPPKQAACLVCRRSKIKCEWSPGQNECKRCAQLDAECIRPTFQAGRQKGIKNKRKGFEKAVFQIEEALRRVKAGKQTGEDSKAIQDLRRLLFDSVDHQPTGQTNPASVSGQPSSAGDSRDVASDDDDDDDDGEADDSPDSRPYIAPHCDGSLTVDDAENPLQLLARASKLQLSPTTGGSASSPGQPARPRGKNRQPENDDGDSEIQSFFTGVRVNLDIGEDIDPIDMGLVTETEAEELFDYFHTNLAHTRWGLDPKLYTVRFTRSRSAFLFTSIMAASALFRPQDAALFKRLSTHTRSLAQRVAVRRHKSVEIVLAFLVNVPWMFPGQHSTDDETPWYVAMATTIAIDLSVHKLLVPTDLLTSAAAVARGDCVDPRTAMAIDGFDHVDPDSELWRRLLRRRERCWIALFVLERGMSLARGRSFTVPITRSLRDCDHWHRSDIADSQDGHLVSIAVLRRDLDSIFATVRAMCDGSQNNFSDSSLIAQSIQGTIERFFDQWYTDWGMSIGSGPQRQLPPYVDILTTHTRLSIYSGVINHPTAPIEVRQFFRTAGMSSALTVMRVAIRGEPLLQSMPNNTAIMITFAACFALTISAYASGSSNLAPSVRTLIEEAAGVLERVGNTTAHRNGLSSLYGRYLRVIVKKAAAAAGGHSAASFHPAVDMGTSGNHNNNRNNDQYGFTAGVSPSISTVGAEYLNPPAQPQPQLWPQTLPFSTMSDEQMVEILNQPHNAFDPAGASLSWEDMNNFEGLSWPNMPGFNF